MLSEKQGPGRGVGGGRPTIDKTKKKTKRITFYLTEIEFERYEILKSKLLKHSPAFTFQKFLRKSINNYDEELLEYLDLLMNDSHRVELKTQSAYKKIFEFSEENKTATLEERKTSHTTDER